MTQPFLTHTLPGRTVTLQDGTEYLWFSGTDYLGMGHHEAFLTYLAEGFRRYGTHFGSSRNNTLRLAVYHQAEEALAAFIQAPAALTVSSGMWAGQLVMKYLEKQNARFHYAPGVHPALWGPDYQPTAGNWTDWVTNTITAIEASAPGQAHVLCTDSIGSPWVESFDLSLFEKLPHDRPLWLVVDDSHGLGVLGPEGRGVFSQLSSHLHLLVTASLNKALGVPGGVILGDAKVLGHIRLSPWFAGSSPSAPAYLYALRENLTHGIYPKAHRQLTENLAYFLQKLSPGLDFAQVPGYPAFCSRRSELYGYLYEHQILTSCFSYPQPTDPAVTRLVVTALHQKQDLDRLAEVLGNFN
jgi:8-amino-7-oxononanoate synthase